MALVLGTNMGFVEVAPTTDPQGALIGGIDTVSRSLKDTSPSTAAKIIEIGWWCNNATEEANFEVGLYNDDGGADPASRLFVDATNAKGTEAGWKVVTVDWTISPSTIYWLAFQLDNTETATDTDTISSGGPGNARKTSSTTLTDPWGSSFSTDVDGGNAIYAVWEAAAAETTNVSTTKNQGQVIA